MRWLIYIIIFCSFFDLFTQLPIMTPFAESLGASAFLTGLTVGMYSLSNTIGNVISGFWTDKKGPYFILCFGLLLTGTSLFLYHTAFDPWSLLAVRFLHGLLAGLIVPAAFTFLANQTTNDTRGKKSAISGAFVGSAAIIGPAFSGILASKTSAPVVFSITGTMLLILGVLSLLLLRKVSISPDTQLSEKEIQRSITVRELFQNYGTIKAFTGAFFLMFSQGVLAYLLPLKVMHAGLDTKTTGLLLSTFGIVAILVFLLPTNRIFDRVVPYKTLSFGIGLMGISLLILSQANTISLLYITMILYGIGFAFLFPSINSLLIDSTDPKIRGKAYGYFYAFFSFGVVIGSGLIGWLGLGADDGFLLTGALLIAFALFSFIQKDGKRV